MRREIFSSDELVVREAADLTPPGYAGQPGFPAHQPHLVVSPVIGVYGRLTRADVERLHEDLGRWLGR